MTARFSTSPKARISPGAIVANGRTAATAFSAQWCWRRGQSGLAPCRDGPDACPAAESRLYRFDYVTRNWDEIRHCVGCYQIEARGRAAVHPDRGGLFRHHGIAASALARLSARAKGNAVMTALCRSDRRSDQAQQIAIDPRILAYRSWVLLPITCASCACRRVWPPIFDNRSGDPDWRGCNITIPHKIAALDHVADPGGVRQSIGAINTVFRGEKGELVGTNTDAAGFFAPISEDEWAHRDADCHWRGWSGARDPVCAGAGRYRFGDDIWRAAH
jgi:hypothetical protein